MSGNSEKRGSVCTLALQTGTGSLPPKILINGGEHRGNWANGPYPPPAPDTIIVNILP
jgi:hypothetical protein